MCKHAEGLSVSEYCLKYQDSIFYRTIIDGRVDNYSLKQIALMVPNEYARIVSMWEQTRFYPFRKGEGK
jgi:hypothetical protein